MRAKKPAGRPGPRRGWRVFRNLLVAALMFGALGGFLWVREGYPVTDDCASPHLPLGEAARRAMERLAMLPIDEDLAADGDAHAVSERADVFASYSEDTDLKQERSWTTENPFAKKE